MSKLFGVSCMLLAACATGGASLDRETGPRAKPGLEISAVDTELVFPAARNPQLPTADRMSKEILAALGDAASADVRLCIAADGHVEGVHVVRGSSLAAFDEAVRHDVADWQFPGMAGASSFASALHTCQVATITYRPHR